MEMLKDRLYMPIYADRKVSHKRVKISIIGCGREGMAAAFCILTKGIATELALIDLDEELVEAELKDLQGAGEYYPGCLIYGGANYKLVSNSTIIIMCEKVPVGDSEDRLNHAQRSLDTFKIDIMCYIAWRLSGFEKNRVFGIGTALESAAFRVGISQKLNVSPSAVRGHILGEHGLQSVPIFSSVECGGVRLRAVYPAFGTEKDAEGYNKIPDTINAKSAFLIIDIVIIAINLSKA
ncbi:unnamed protein product [Hydatigera taeniaeformis]|uniref:Ldh_1_N domain-containing protein n=1 Tax=Hydatigena taeniaeformis TaxID=6205 RepID=A0A0R3WK11_HYDTA|nr:unnamed protein product [Hydatigera taeniaeformis]